MVLNTKWHGHVPTFVKPSLLTSASASLGPTPVCPQMRSGVATTPVLEVDQHLYHCNYSIQRTKIGIVLFTRQVALVHDSSADDR